METSEPFVADPNQMTSRANRSNPKPGDPSHPLVKGDAPLLFESRVARNGRGAPSETARPLKAQSGQTGKGDGAPLLLTSEPPRKEVMPSEVPAESILSAEASHDHAKTCPSPDAGLALLVPDPASSGSLPESLARYAPHGFSLRMWSDSLAPTEGTILRSSSTRWGNSAMGGPIGYSTLDTSECPRGAVESTLSAILQDGAIIPQRYYLSPKAAAGILRRAERRGKQLPHRLEQALRALVDGAATSTTKPTSPKSPMPAKRRTRSAPARRSAGT